ncbi:hypothetical protein AC4HA11_0125 [Escherichia phage vB_EcoA_4HA11]|nr:hypothetical protein AC4HA11_0125 [Escherichia phage vB_EcoA_4HA11]
MFYLRSEAPMVFIISYLISWFLALSKKR